MLDIDCILKVSLTITTLIFCLYIYLTGALWLSFCLYLLCIMMTVFLRLLHPYFVFWLIAPHLGY